MTAKQFRKMALEMTGAIESAHMGHPDFRANGRIFATLNADETRGAVKLTPEQQTMFVRDHAGSFVPESGAWGRDGWTRVILAGIDDDALGEALTLGWQNVSAATRRRRRTRR